MDLEVGPPAVWPSRLGIAVEAHGTSDFRKFAEFAAQKG
jgi:hypothetical protein